MQKLAARVLGTRLGARLGRSLVVHTLRHVPLFAQLDEPPCAAWPSARSSSCCPRAGMSSRREVPVTSCTCWRPAWSRCWPREASSWTSWAAAPCSGSWPCSPASAARRPSARRRPRRSSAFPARRSCRCSRGMTACASGCGRRSPSGASMMRCGLEGYGHLGRARRLSLLRSGEHRELRPQEWQTLEAGTHLFVLSGAVDFEHAGLVVTSGLHAAGGGPAAPGAGPGSHAARAPESAGRGRPVRETAGRQQARSPRCSLHPRSRRCRSLLLHPPRSLLLRSRHRRRAHRRFST